MTFREVYSIVMPEKKRLEERFNIFAHWVGRPISIVITLPLLKTKISPTTVTKWSIFYLLLGSSLVSFGNSMSYKIMGWTFFLFWNLLDGVDGNLARCKDQCSALGDLWDTMAGYAAIILTYFSAGIAAFFDSSQIVFCEDYWLLILGGITSLVSIFPRLILHKKKSSNNDSRGVKVLSDKSAFCWRNVIIMNLISPSGLMQVIFLMCIIFHLLNIFITIYAIINLFVMLFSLHELLVE